MIRKCFEYHPEESFHEKDVKIVLSFTVKGFQIISVCTSEKRLLGIEDFVVDSSGATLNFGGNEFESHCNRFIQRYGSVSSFHVMLNSGIFVPVPEELFDESRIEELLKFVTTDETFFDKDFHYNLIGQNTDSFYLLYRFLNWQTGLINEDHSDRTKHCDIVAFLNAILSSEMSSSGTFVNVGSNSFDVVILNRKSLLFINRFNFATTKDFCYHLIGAMKSAGLNVFDETVSLSGEILPGSEITSLLAKYVAAIRFMHPPDVDVPENLHAHRYFYQLSVL